VSLPDVVTREEWLAARKQLLAAEKEMTRRRDTLNAGRRRLPMVKLTEDYVFEGPSGQVSLAGLFGESKQLVVQHVMFGPDWEKPCPSCSVAISEMTPSLFKNLRSRETNFVLTSRAPYAKIAAAKAERGWDVPWYSSFGSSFNDDYEVTVDPAAPRYNYRDEPEIAEATELPGFSCFLRDGDSVYHTYSTYARGTEYIGNAYTLLDLTALGRQETWEEPKDRTAAAREGDPSFSS
jgi:predicted dithiol-disulfide oxidoreductase (DUF899 family)